MGQFTCIYYQNDTGRAPVKEFISLLHSRTRQKYYEIVELLEDSGKALPGPYADYLGDDIYELRFIGIEGKVRVLYFFYHDQKIVLTNGFIKKQQKTPKRELKLTKDRRNHYLDQHKGNL